MEYDVIQIPVSDGTERDFAIMNSFQVDGRDYIAVSLVEGDEIREGIYLYRSETVSEGELIVEQIESAREYETVVKAFEALED
ncbi:MAG: DUF1292 domain-containing protein [Acetatifactor sp.]